MGYTLSHPNQFNACLLQLALFMQGQFMQGQAPSHQHKDLIMTAYRAPLPCLIGLLMLLCSPLSAAPGLPADFDADPGIPSPAEFFGFEVGEWHPRHDQIHAYLTELAARSDRVRIETIGQTHGLRPLTLLTFTSPQRLGDLDRIRADRLRASRAGDGPLVVWLGYAVHGNEASAASAAVVTAYYLAASREAQVLEWLDNMVIVMEPVLNPDGLDRFAHWVNSHRGIHPPGDSADREHHEAWPSGRTNYYWFDLNRDWLPLVHPESQARMAHYHQWRPHVLADHHEMGHNSTYFFQPGVPERVNPLMPNDNQSLTAAIAEFHAAWLDAAGEPYYTRESFDDWYTGKGSTYPDLTGGVGILFEQGSSRGHVQDTVYGRRHFRDAIANQVGTSLSTLAGSWSVSNQLIAYQRRTLADNPVAHAGWVLADGGDPVRAQRLVALLLKHHITVHPVTSAVEVGGRSYGPGQAWVIPAAQDMARLLQSILTPTEITEVEVFYDVSTWPLGLSFNLPLSSVRRLPAHGEALQAAPTVAVAAPSAEALAWLMPWNQAGAPAALAALLAEGYRVQVLTQPTQPRVQGARRTLVRGSVLVHSGLQASALPAVGARLQALAAQHQVEVLAVESGLVHSGLDLGSPSAPVLQPINVAMLVGPGVRANHAGYLWHWFDHRLQQPLTQLDWARLARVDLSAYSHLILPDGNYGFLSSAQRGQLEQFVRNGGVLIAARGAAAWVEQLDLGWNWVAGQGDDDASEESSRRPYDAFTLDQARTLIGGSVLSVNLDITHPLAFGYMQSELPVFRRGRHRLRSLNDPYAQVAVYAEQPLRSGYLSEPNRQRLAGTPSLAASRHGRGAVVRMADDVVFRGYWAGTEPLLANALFFTQVIRSTRSLDEGEE